jgi:hypothetical protein
LKTSWLRQGRHNAWAQSTQNVQRPTMTKLRARRLNRCRPSIALDDHGDNNDGAQAMATQNNNQHRQYVSFSRKIQVVHSPKVSPSNSHRCGLMLTLAASRLSRLQMMTDRGLQRHERGLPGRKYPVLFKPRSLPFLVFESTLFFFSTLLPLF